MRKPMSALVSRGACCLTLVLGLTAPASAQTTPKEGVSGGYQLIHFSVGGESESFPEGWYADVAGNFNQTLGNAPPSYFP